MAFMFSPSKSPVFPLNFLYPGTFNGRDRTALAVNIHSGPNLAVCSSVNGKGLALFDLRMPLPLDFVHEVCTSLTPFILERTSVILLFYRQTI